MFDEKEVVARILAGDAYAFELLVSQYENLVFHVISRLVDQKESVEDVCQDVFVKVYKGLDRFGFQSKLSTWIARIAYLTSLNYLRKHAKGPRFSTPEQIEAFHFSDDDPLTVLTRKDFSAYIHTLIAQLPLPYKTVLTLYHLESFSYREIEDITGMPEGTIKSYLFRARKLLKDKMATHLQSHSI
jgi:RNA polymerase sigma factor (sigma-70 family)